MAADQQKAGLAGDGESFRDFEAIRQMMVDDVEPETNFEWLWTLDLIKLSWQIVRYRRLRETILDVHRVTAIEAMLQRLDGEGTPAEAMPMVRTRVKRTAADWRDPIDINAEVFVQARELFDTFRSIHDRGATRVRRVIKSAG